MLESLWLMVTKSTYCWWKKSCTTWDVQNLVNNGIFTISTGAGFLPSTVGKMSLELEKDTRDELVNSSNLNHKIGWIVASAAWQKQLYKQFYVTKCHRFFHNHGSGQWWYLKGNYLYWRDPFFTSMIMGGRVKADGWTIEIPHEINSFGGDLWL